MSSVDRTTRLAEVTFCVLDLETTGTSDELDEIVEVGAVLVRGGEELGSFQTMVRHPLATGPSEVPGSAAVLASLLEFIRGAVIVGHNIRFDLRFLNAALWKSNHDVVLDPELAIDTVPLARRLLRDDADDCRLGTLAQRFQFDTRPTHRALADAQATVELLHLLIERATHYGALDLDDLMRLPGLMRHPCRDKLAATAHLPRAAGVARLVDRYDQTLHVVVAADVRHAVRQLFHRDDRSEPPLPTAVLRHVHRVDAVPSHHPLVARVAALRWSSSIAAARAVSATYLQRSPTTGRVRVVTDRLAADLVAGPMPRPQSRLVTAALAAATTEVRDRFVTAMIAAEAPAIDGFDDIVLADAVHRQRSLCRARAWSGSVEVDGARVTVHNGRIVDIGVNGRSSAADLPPYVDEAPRGVAMTIAHADEALLVAELLALAQPACEILET